MVAASKDKTAANSDLGDIALKCLIVLLVIMLLGLQFRLWVGEGSLAEVKNLSDKVVEQRDKNQQMEASNQQLAAEVNALKMVWPKSKRVRAKNWEWLNLARLSI